MKTTIRITAILLFTLLTISNSGCFMLSDNISSDDSYGDVSAVTEATGPSHTDHTYSDINAQEADTNTAMIGEDMLGQTVRIRGIISEVKRFDSGHALAKLTDDSGMITVYFHRDSNTDLVLLITDHEYLISGTIDSYKGELQVLPQNSSDVQLISNINFEPVEVVKIVDGDTIHVKNMDGDTETVRMIGVDTPELAKDNKMAEFYAEQAHAYSNTKLMNQTVYLEKDHDDRDQYGRKLRYVWLSQPQTINETIIREKLFSALLLSEGFARFVHYNDDRKYKELLTEIESEAQYEAIGIWQQN